MSFLAAWRFLTTIPIPFKKEEWWRQSSKVQFSHSMKYYPAIGLAVGVILGSVNWLIDPILPSEVKSAALLLLLVLITGGLHLDGFLDTVDGLAAGHRDNEARKRVMKEPGVGAIGVVFVVILLIIKFVLIDNIPDDMVFVTFIIMAVTSRWAMVYSLVIYPYVRKSGLGTGLKNRTGIASFIIATFSAIFFVTICGQWLGLIIFGLTWFLVVGISAFFKAKFGGHTGDTYGAVNEIIELFALAIIVLVNYNLA
jgi:adenosylcobinamide-GDP ribazoletransferase